MAEFSMLEGLFGGALIGLAASLLLLLKGRIAGISGILSGVLTRSDQIGWQLPFVLGLIISWPLYERIHGDITFIVNDSLPLLALAGMLVGLGTRIGNGCTSGHGVCGVARLSPRSLVATATFMLVGIVAASVLRPWLLSAGVSL